MVLQVENIINSLTLLERIGVILDGITAKDVREGNLKTILGLFFALSKYKQQQKQRQAAQAVQAVQTAIANERLYQKRQPHLAPLSEEMKQSRYVHIDSIDTPFIGQLQRHKHNLYVLECPMGLLFVN